MKIYEEKYVMGMYYDKELNEYAHKTLRKYEELGKLEEVCDFIEEYMEETYGDTIIKKVTLEDFIWFRLEETLKEYSNL